MSNKNPSREFHNRAARRFRDINHIDKMSQQEVFDILDEDIDTILGQVISFRDRSVHGPKPEYIVNAFANLSTALWFYKYIDTHVHVNKKRRVIKTDLEEGFIDALKWILAEVYRKSATNYYAKQTDEFVDRDEYVSRAFIKLDPMNYQLAKKLKLEKIKTRSNVLLDEPEKLIPDTVKTRDLVIHIYNNPVSDFRFIHRIINESSVSDKKKMKILKKMYGDRFIIAVGAAFTVDNNNSDCLAMLFGYLEKLKKKKKYKKVSRILHAYADAYKSNRRSYYRVTRAKFYKTFKTPIKLLIKHDIGYKKAFREAKKNFKYGELEEGTKRPNNKRS